LNAVGMRGTEEEPDQSRSRHNLDRLAARIRAVLVLVTWAATTVDMGASNQHYRDAWIGALGPLNEMSVLMGVLSSMPHWSS
jgi:hypothetical protein